MLMTMPMPMMMRTERNKDRLGRNEIIVMDTRCLLFCYLIINAHFSFTRHFSCNAHFSFTRHSACSIMHVFSLFLHQGGCHRTWNRMGTTLTYSEQENQNKKEQKKGGKKEKRKKSPVLRKGGATCRWSACRTKHVFNRMHESSHDTLYQCSIANQSETMVMVSVDCSSAA